VFITQGTRSHPFGYEMNAHPASTVSDLRSAIDDFVVPVRDRVCPGESFAIAPHIGQSLAGQLSRKGVAESVGDHLRDLDLHLYTVNAFPLKDFHAKRVKEQVYRPDWTTPERVEYTKRLFDILAELAPADAGGSVSTVPCSFKEFITTDEQARAMRRNLWEVVEHIDALSEKSGKDLHLGLEPEPLCYLETSEEMIRFYRQLQDDRPGDDRLAKRLGINYDTCHLAVEFEEAAVRLARWPPRVFASASCTSVPRSGCRQVPRCSTA
jgi:hypothetical protein